MDTGNIMRYQWEKWDLIGSSDPSTASQNDLGDLMRRLVECPLDASSDTQIGQNPGDPYQTHTENHLNQCDLHPPHIQNYPNI